MFEYLVEFLGTAFFVFIIISTGNPLAIGAALALVILLAKNISGGHMNPAVTISMSAMGNLPSTQVIPYCIAQIMGGLVAVQLYKRIQV